MGNIGGAGTRVGDTQRSVDQGLGVSVDANHKILSNTVIGSFDARAGTAQVDAAGLKFDPRQELSTAVDARQAASSQLQLAGVGGSAAMRASGGDGGGDMMMMMIVAVVFFAIIGGAGYYFYNNPPDAVKNADAGSMMDAGSSLF